VSVYIHDLVSELIFKGLSWQLKAGQSIADEHRPIVLQTLLLLVDVMYWLSHSSCMELAGYG